MDKGPRRRPRSGGSNAGGLVGGTPPFILAIGAALFLLNVLQYLYALKLQTLYYNYSVGNNAQLEGRVRDGAAQMGAMSNLRAEFDDECTNKLIRLRELELEKVASLTQKNEKTQELLDKTKEYLANVKDGLAKKTAALDAKTDELKALKAVCDGGSSVQQQQKLSRERSQEEGEYDVVSTTMEGKSEGAGGHKKNGSGKVTRPKRVPKDQER